MSVFEEWNQRESLSNPPKAAGSRSSHVASQPSAAPANNPFARGGAGGASPPRASISGGSASGANPFTRGGSNPNQGASSALATAQTSDTKVLATASDAADRDSIFSLEPIPWQDTVGGSGVSSVAVGNSLMCLALPGCRILRSRATRCFIIVRLVCMMMRTECRSPEISSLLPFDDTYPNHQKRLLLLALRDHCAQALDRFLPVMPI